MDDIIQHILFRGLNMSKTRYVDRSWPAGVPGDPEPPPATKPAPAEPARGGEVSKYEPRPRLLDWIIRGFGFALGMIALYIAIIVGILLVGVAGTAGLLTWFGSVL